MYQVSLCTCGKWFTQRILVRLGVFFVVVVLLLLFFVFNVTGPFLSHLFFWSAGLPVLLSASKCSLHILALTAKCSYSMIPNHLNGKHHASVFGGFPYVGFLVLSSLWLSKEGNCSATDCTVGVFYPLCWTCFLDLVEYIQRTHFMYGRIVVHYSAMTKRI